ncbi:unnamed protein product [Amoebophrya sp. A25]|nr:unnamed protein product [Amoebophrya sp. A25]|eukprot:GSA25T00019345001.1
MTQIASRKMEETNSVVPILVGTAFGETRSVFLLQLDCVTGLLSYKQSFSLPHASPGWLLHSTVEVKDGVEVGRENASSSKNDSCKILVAYEESPGLVQAFYTSVDETSSGASDGAKEGVLDFVPASISIPSEGDAACHLSTDTTGKWIFVSNYCSGNVGILSCLNTPENAGLALHSVIRHPPSANYTRQLDPALTDRQEAPHCHCTAIHPSNRWVAVADLGLSIVSLYPFDSQTGLVVEAEVATQHLELPIDAGPRHLLWTKDGRYLFILNELNATLSLAEMAPTNDGSTSSTRLRIVQTIQTDTKKERRHHLGNSDLQLHPNGRFLYVGARTHTKMEEGIGCILVYEIVFHEETGAVVGGEGCDSKKETAIVQDLRLLDIVSTQGLVPRNFKILSIPNTDTTKASSKMKIFLVVGNQESYNVVTFHVDSESGMLSFAHKLENLPNKPCNICPILS